VLTVDHLRGQGLRDVAFTVAEGTGLAIIGPSGAGKSLLLRALADLDPAEGSVILTTTGAGVLDRSLVDAPTWRRHVAYVPTESGWWADRVGDHFRDPAVVAPILVDLGLPADCLGWTVQRLSSGERQRCALARALEQAPEVLLLDEPTSSLDDTATKQLEAVLRRRLAEGVHLVLVSHDPDQPARLALPTRRMVDGRLLETESMAETVG